MRLGVKKDRYVATHYANSDTYRVVSEVAEVTTIDYGPKLCCINRAHEIRSYVDQYGAFK